MNDIEQERLRKVRKWLSYADEDLCFAQHGLKMTAGMKINLSPFYCKMEATG